MAYVTVWQQDFLKADRLEEQAVKVLYEQGVISWAFKPNRKGTKLKPVLVSHYVFSKIRDLSLTMGPRVIEGNAMGRGHCKAIVAEWGRTRLRFA